MQKLIVGFTGTRHGMSKSQKIQLINLHKTWLKKYDFVEAHHGDCIGADSEFHNSCLIFWEEQRLEIIVHPPLDESKRAFMIYQNQQILNQKEYLQRNKDIVDSSEIIVAAPLEDEALRSGTWSTIRYSRRKNKELIILKR